MGSTFEKARNQDDRESEKHGRYRNPDGDRHGARRIDKPRELKKKRDADETDTPEHADSAIIRPVIAENARNKGIGDRNRALETDREHREHGGRNPHVAQDNQHRKDEDHEKTKKNHHRTVITLPVNLGTDENREQEPRRIEDSLKESDDCRRIAKTGKKNWQICIDDAVNREQKKKRQTHYHDYQGTERQ